MTASVSPEPKSFGRCATIGCYDQATTDVRMTIAGENFTESVCEECATSYHATKPSDLVSAEASGDLTPYTRRPALRAERLDARC